MVAELTTAAIFVGSGDEKMCKESTPKCVRHQGFGMHPGKDGDLWAGFQKVRTQLDSCI